MPVSHPQMKLVISLHSCNIFYPSIEEEAPLFGAHRHRSTPKIRIDRVINWKLMKKEFSIYFDPDKWFSPPLRSPRRHTHMERRIYGSWRLGSFVTLDSSLTTFFGQFNLCETDVERTKRAAWHKWQNRPWENREFLYLYSSQHTLLHYMHSEISQLALTLGWMEGEEETPLL